MATYTLHMCHLALRTQLQGKVINIPPISEVHTTSPFGSPALLSRDICGLEDEPCPRDPPTEGEPRPRDPRPESVITGECRMELGPVCGDRSLHVASKQQPYQ